jgi:hypothetical protein
MGQLARVGSRPLGCAFHDDVVDRADVVELVCPDRCSVLGLRSGSIPRRSHARPGASSSRWHELSGASADARERCGDVEHAGMDNLAPQRCVCPARGGRGASVRRAGRRQSHPLRAMAPQRAGAAFALSDVALFIALPAVPNQGTLTLGLALAIARAALSPTKNWIGVAIAAVSGISRPTRWYREAHPRCPSAPSSPTPSASSAAPPTASSSGRPSSSCAAHRAGSAALTMRPHFYTFSLRNQILLAMQKPDASRVAGAIPVAGSSHLGDAIHGAPPYGLVGTVLERSRSVTAPRGRTPLVASAPK